MRSIFVVLFALSMNVQAQDTASVGDSNYEPAKYQPMPVLDVPQSTVDSVIALSVLSDINTLRNSNSKAITCAYTKASAKDFGLQAQDESVSAAHARLGFLCIREKCLTLDKRNQEFTKKLQSLSNKDLYELLKSLGFDESRTDSFIDHVRNESAQEGPKAPLTCADLPPDMRRTIFDMCMDPRVVECRKSY